MRTLQELREQLDRVDNEIVSLYQERMGLCREVGEYKIGRGKKVFDKQREKEKLTAVAGKVSTEFEKKGITELYEQLMAMSRKLQYHILNENGTGGRLPFIEIDKLDVEGAKVVYQGVPGAYSEEALGRYFGDKLEKFAVQTFRDAMEVIEEGAADFAVLPIENSSAGPVNDVYDLLVDFEHYIVGEIELPVKHALVGIEGAKLEEIEKVYSHPQALMQCAKSLDTHRDWKQISVANTAVAAKKILEDKDKRKAAICSEHAAGLYALQILKEQMNDNENNYTKFIIVTNQKVFLKNAKKISICFEVPHESGSLYRILSHFIYNDLNMTKIESRPLAGSKWEYRFFVDFEGNLSDGAVKNAIRGMREEARNMKILGNY